MHRTILTPLLLCLYLFWGCSQANKEMAMDAITNQTIESPTVDISDVEPMGLKVETTSEIKKPNLEKISLEKKIIRTGNISIESKDLKKSKSNIDILIKKAGGYYEQETTSAGSTYANFSLTIRIPSVQFDSFLDNIEKSGDRLTEKSIQAQDVSLQYYDLESRLKSKRAYIERYQKMVANAKTVKELLEIEEQIRQLQEEIESTESTLRIMKDQIGYSTLHIQLFNSDSPIAHSNSGFWLKIKEAFGFGWELIEHICIGLIGIWPILLFLVAGFLFWRNSRKKKQNK